MHVNKVANTNNSKFAQLNNPSRLVVRIYDCLWWCRRQLTLPSEVEDSLVTKFSESAHAVRYEKLIQYLSSVRLEANRTVPPPGQPQVSGDVS